jgi:hypothetical protein
VPTSQLEQAVAPTAAACLPAAQLAHALATAPEYLPAPQVAQLALCALTADSPALQFRQADAPVALWKVPTTQPAHAAEAPPAAKLPTGHCMQAWAPTAPW